MTAQDLAGQKILLAEDEFFIADEIATALQRRGAEVVGPASTVRHALDLMEGNPVLDAAIIDVNLQGEASYPIAEALKRRNIPFVFASGYDRSSLPERFADVALYRKPTDLNRLVEALSGRTARPQDVHASTFRNRLLEAMSDADRSLLAPYLVKIDIDLHQTLQSPGAPMEHAYFIESGMASVIAGGDGDRPGVEVGLIGREGVAGPAIILGGTSSPHGVIMQTPGSAYRIATRFFHDALKRSGSLVAMLNRFMQVFMTQSSEAVVANARGHIDERLARWLLMAQDRLDTRELSLTHSTLAFMLGVRRAGVTDAIHILEGDHLVRATRGSIIIRDRQGLIAKAGPYYGLAEAEYERLLADYKA